MTILEDPMQRLKTALTSLLLVVVACLLVACGNGPTAQAPVYSPGQLAEVQRYEESVLISYDRFTELPTLLAQTDWTNMRNLIHGPLGDLRQKMSNLSSILLGNDKKQAEKLTQEFFQHLESLDGAAKAQEVQRAETLLTLAENSFQAFLDLLPSTHDAAA